MHTRPSAKMAEEIDRAPRVGATEICFILLFATKLHLFYYDRILYAWENHVVALGSV